MTTLPQQDFEALHPPLAGDDAEHWRHQFGEAWGLLHLSRVRLEKARKTANVARSQFEQAATRLQNRLTHAGWSADAIDQAGRDYDDAQRSAADAEHLYRDALRDIRGRQILLHQRMLAARNVAGFPRVEVGP